MRARTLLLHTHNTLAGAHARTHARRHIPSRARIYIIYTITHTLLSIFTRNERNNKLNLPTSWLDARTISEFLNIPRKKFTSNLFVTNVDRNSKEKRKHYRNQREGAKTMDNFVENTLFSHSYI